MYTETKKPILILGVGNWLQTDDGIGVVAVERIAGMDLPDCVEVIDGGTSGIDLVAVVDGRRTVIVIDAVDGGQPAGTLYRFTPEDIETDLHFDSLHQIGLLESLRMAMITGSAPEKTIVFGVQPGVVDWGTTLTEPVRAAVPKVISQVMKEVDSAIEELENSTFLVRDKGETRERR